MRRFSLSAAPCFCSPYGPNVCYLSATMCTRLNAKLKQGDPYSLRIQETTPRGRKHQAQTKRKTILKKIARALISLPLKKRIGRKIACTLKVASPLNNSVEACDVHPRKRSMCVSNSWLAPRRTRYRTVLRHEVPPLGWVNRRCLHT